jgi:hypothetical protein
VEILLADWIPRKIVASPGQLSKAPALRDRHLGAISGLGWAQGPIECRP